VNNAENIPSEYAIVAASADVPERIFVALVCAGFALENWQTKAKYRAL
jgi:hypothetical protein